MFLIGLTGNIGVGKSTVCDMLAQLGARVVDADLVAHAVLLRGTPAWRGVVDAFGYEVLQDDGSVDRRKLGATVFGSPARLQMLESITHPAVGTELALVMRDALAAPGAGDQVMVLEAVKLFEAGLHRYCDALWVVTAPPAEQKRRLTQERGMIEQEAEARLRAQPPLDEKLRHARVVIDNGGTIENTRVQVMRAFVEIDPGAASDKTGLLLHWLRIPLAPVPAPPLPAAPLAPPTPASQAATPPPEPTAPHIGEPQAAEPPAPAASIAAPQPVVRRVRPGDVDQLARLLTRIEGRAQSLTRAEVLERLGKLGYWLLESNGDPTALAAWQAENLVAVVRELWADSPDTATRALPLLLQAVEQEADTLTCEVVVIVASGPTAALAERAVELCGYQPAGLDALHPHWRGVIVPTLRGDEALYTKQLRDLVTRPI